MAGNRLTFLSLCVCVSIGGSELLAAQLRIGSQYDFPQMSGVEV